MFVTDCGMLIVSHKPYANEYSSIVVTLFGIVMFNKCSLSDNEPLLIVFTVFGIAHSVEVFPAAYLISSDLSFEYKLPSYEQ